MSSPQQLYMSSFLQIPPGIQLFLEAPVVLHRYHSTQVLVTPDGAWFWDSYWLNLLWVTCCSSEGKIWFLLCIIKAPQTWKWTHLNAHKQQGNKPLPSSVLCAESLACPLLGGWGRIYHLGNHWSWRKRDAEGLEALQPEQSLLVSLSSHLIRRWHSVKLKAAIYLEPSH